MTLLAAIIAIATVPAIAVATLALPSRALPSSPPKTAPSSSFAVVSRESARSGTMSQTEPSDAAHRSEAVRPSSVGSRTRPSSFSGPGQRSEQGQTAGQWSWPLLPIPRVVRGFQIGPEPWSPGHRGVDLEARPGVAVHAPAAGVIRFSGVLAGRSVLAIDHGGGLISSFEPAIGRLPAGAMVRPGDVVATIASGTNHCLPSTCLHWGVRRDGRYIDPLTLLPGLRGPAVLLPMLS